MFIISGCWIGATLHSKSLFNKEFIILLITLFLIFVSWLLASFGFSEMVSMIHWSLTKTSETIGIDMGIESSFNMNPLSIIGNLIGYPYFLFMCCILPFIFLSTKFVHLPDKKTHLQQLLAISFGVLFTAFFITNMLGSGMQHRFMPYLGIFTAIGFAYILWYVFVKASQNPKTIKTVCLSIGIFIAAFSMINLPYYEISNDNNPYLNEKMHSLSVSSADLTALQTISTYLPRPGYSVYCDSIELVRCLAYTTYINDYKTAHVIPEQSKVGALPDWDLIDNYTDGYLILRDDLQTHSAYNRFIAASGKPYGKRTWINEAIIRNLKTNNNCIYSNNELEILTLI